MSPSSVDRPDDAPVSLTGILRNREFRGMYFAHLASIVGDQVAKVALAILVYDRTSSAALSALVYALTLLPWLAAPWLAILGDRYPRRDVLVGCDIARAVVVALMVVPGIPLAVLLPLLAAVSLLAPPFEAARSALLADLLTGPRYVAATTLTQLSSQGGQVLGFAAGGVIVSTLRVRGALALDGLTFLVSAAMLLLVVRSRPAAAPRPPARRRPPGTQTSPSTPEPASPQPASPQPESSERAPSERARWNDGLTYVLGDPVLRSLALLVWIIVFFAIAPEGLAVAIAHRHGRANLDAGLLTAAVPLGVFAGTFAVGRLLPLAGQLALMLPLALAGTGALGLTALVPSVPGLMALWGLAGSGLAFNLPANAAFVRATKNEMRAQAFGVASAGLQLAQAAGLLVAGVAADHLAPRTVVTLAGAAGSCAVIGLWATWPRTNVVQALKFGQKPDIS